MGFSQQVVVDYPSHLKEFLYEAKKMCQAEFFFRQEGQSPPTISLVFGFLPNGLVSEFVREPHGWRARHVISEEEIRMKLPDDGMYFEISPADLEPKLPQIV